MLTIPRVFSKEGVHPYDEINWVKKDVVQKNWKTGKVTFEQYDVEFPDFYSDASVTIVTSRYFRGKIGDPDREWSLKQLVDRVVNKYTKEAVERGYLDEENGKIFNEELKWLIVNQYFSFNSPVWFNVGGPKAQQVSACFILGVEDNMESILNWYREEGLIFKGGSGAGINLSKLRSSFENLSTGGKSSGPVTFSRAADASAGTIKSGGATRRAAKMVVLDVDHPDIEEFIWCKAKEEKKIRALSAAGFDMGLGGEDAFSVQYQNANNSVRLSDDFMRKYEAGEDFQLTARTDGRVIKELPAKDLMRQIAQASWECADPGVQFTDTINDWHTLPKEGPITASNPCSEYLSIDNSSCNLSSFNLVKFLGENNHFDIARFVAAIDLVLLAMDVSVDFADFPTEAITENTRKFRQLGLGVANLGSLLMILGLPYDSDGGRSLAAAIHSLMTASAYRRSTEIAEVKGPYFEWNEKHSKSHQRVIRKHIDANERLVDLSIMDANIQEAATQQWKIVVDRAKEFGIRNAQVSLAAPTGTISFFMGASTTGIEPDFSLVKYKTTAAGESLVFANENVGAALKNLGYSEEAVLEIEKFVVENNSVVGAPGLRERHYDVFDTAVGARSISPMGHILLMAAIQPFLSGAISKTVNLPNEATVEDIEETYYKAWKLGIKCVAIYRDGSKNAQPLSNKKLEEDSEKNIETKVVEKIVQVPMRRKMPVRRRGTTNSFQVADVEGYLRTGEYEDGTLGEMFLTIGKSGTTLSGLVDAFCLAISLGLQYGVPLDRFVEKFLNQRFEPAGITQDPDINMSQSLIDYIFRRLAIDYMGFEERAEYGIYTTAERKAAVQNGGIYEPIEEKPAQDEIAKNPKVIHKETANPQIVVEKIRPVLDVPDCPTCQTKVNMQRSGACYICSACGSSTGCS